MLFPKQLATGKSPFRVKKKKSWWAVHKHHRYYVNKHANMYINACYPMCTHQTAIRASIKGANLQQGWPWPASAFPLSFVFSTVVSASALIIDVSPCIRRTMMVRSWEVCRAAGWGTKLAPTRCVGLRLPRKATVEQRRAAKSLQCLQKNVFTRLFLEIKNWIAMHKCF